MRKSFSEYDYFLQRNSSMKIFNSRAEGSIQTYKLRSETPFEMPWTVTNTSLTLPGSSLGRNNNSIWSSIIFKFLIN